MTPELLTPQEVADWLKIPRGSVMRLVWAGKLKAIYVSPKVVRFEKDEVREFLERN